ncbi:MAG TPA: polysaccharide deacetylase family protein [Gaiellales bacterium]
MSTGGRPLMLAYHAISSAWASPLAISPDALDHQAAHLRRRGYQGLTFGEAERRRAQGTLPARTVVFSFDDGYASTLRAAEVLARHGYPGTVFVVGRFAESGEPLRWQGIEHELDDGGAELDPLSWEQLARLAAQGWEVGSHTVSHPLLTALSDADLESELTESRRLVADRMGGCDTIAYPYGQADARVTAAAAAAGYTAACTLTGAHLADEPYRRPRVNMTGADTGGRLRLKVSPAGVGLRRSAVARTVRRLRRRRDWLPSAAPARETPLP